MPLQLHRGVAPLHPAAAPAAGRAPKSPKRQTRGNQSPKRRWQKIPRHVIIKWRRQNNKVAFRSVRIKEKHNATVCSCRSKTYTATRDVRIRQTQADTSPSSQTHSRHAAFYRSAPAPAPPSATTVARLKNCPCRSRTDSAESCDSSLCGVLLGLLLMVVVVVLRRLHEFSVAASSSSASSAATTASAATTSLPRSSQKLSVSLRALPLSADSAASNS